MMKENEEKPDDEKLDREDFILDLKHMEAKEAERNHAVAELREEIELEILKQQYLREKVKKECWDSMAVKGKVVYGFETSLEVLYSLKRASQKL